VFGKENVKIFIFEEFVRNPGAFVIQLCNTMGIDADEGLKLISGKRSNERITTGYLRRLDEIEKSEDLTRQFRSATPGKKQELLNPNDPSGEKINPQLSAEWLRKINAIGDEQNRRLVKDWDLPLAEYKYRV
jgi:hypothetical protein